MAEDGLVSTGRVAEWFDMRVSALRYYEDEEDVRRLVDPAPRPGVRMLAEGRIPALEAHGPAGQGGAPCRKST